MSDDERFSRPESETPASEKIVLSTEQRSFLEQLARSPKASNLRKKRARILLQADQGPLGPGWKPPQIVEGLHVHPAVVERTCEKYVRRGLPELLRPPRPSKSLLEVPPLVVRPTATSVTLHVVVGPRPIDLDVLLHPPGEVCHRTRLAPEMEHEIVLEGLQPDSEYTYAVEAKHGFEQETSAGRFVTRRSAGERFRFAVLSDPHLPVLAPEWLTSASQEHFQALLDFSRSLVETSGVLRKVLTTIRERRVDFMICLGDNIHHRVHAQLHRHLDTEMRRSFLNLRKQIGRAGAETALFNVLGNWDGESGWHAQSLRDAARDARLRFLPAPMPETYPEGGGAAEDYYAWTWGDALFIVLNVVSYTTTRHSGADDDDGKATDFTLGEEQLAWLEKTLAASDAPLKMIFAHHPVGGYGGDAAASAYGRGGGRAAHVGEQAIVHRLMREHGVQIFFYGHDHVFTDMIVDDVHYTLPGSAGAPWRFPDEHTGYVRSDRRSGFAIVEVDSSGVQVDFVDTDGEAFDGYRVDLAPNPEQRH